MRPKAEATSATIFFTAASSPVSVLNSSTFTPLLPAISLAARRERGLVARDDGDVDAFPRQLPGDGLADAAIAAGDDRGLALEFEVHEVFRPVLRIVRCVRR